MQIMFVDTIYIELYSEAFLVESYRTDTNPLLTNHAANEYGGWVKIVKRFRLSHKPMGLASVERVTV